MSDYLNDPPEYNEQSEEGGKNVGDDMLRSAREIGKEVGFPETFLDDLIKDVKAGNDWVFVIKSHAVMETAITHVLSERLRITNSPEGYKKDKISNFVARLPMSGRNGKVRLGVELELIPRDVRKFTERLSEIRNFYVHDLRNVEVTLDHYIFELENHRQHEFFAAFIPKYKKNEMPLEDFPRGWIKPAILMTMCANLILLHINLKLSPHSLDKLYDQPRG